MSVWEDAAGCKPLDGTVDVIRFSFAKKSRLIQYRILENTRVVVDVCGIITLRWCTRLIMTVSKVGVKRPLFDDAQMGLCPANAITIADNIQMTQSCLSLNEELWQAEYLASDSESRWKLNRRRDQIYVAFLSFLPGSSCSLGFPAGSKLWAAQLAQFLWFNQMLKLSGLIVQRCSKSCRNVHSDPCHQIQLIPKISATLQLLDSRAGPKTSIVAPFLGVPPGSMWGGPEASVMQLLPLCVGTLLFHCEGSQWIRTSMQLRWIFLHLRYLSPIRLQLAHWFLMMQMMWMNVNECKS